MNTLNLTHAQKMQLGAAAIFNERTEDGYLMLPGDTRVKNNLTKKGIARLVEGVWVDHWGRQYRTKDWYIKPEYESLCESLEEYNERHDKPFRGPSSLTPEEWESVAG